MDALPGPGALAVAVERHWAAQYVGMPWENGAQGPEAFDCWGFFRHVQRSHYGIEVPVIVVEGDLTTKIGRLRWLWAVGRTFEGHAEFARWLRVDEPRDGDAVILRSGKDPWHIGVWLEVDGGRVLHCHQDAGVLCEPPLVLRFQGWGQLEFWRFRGMPH